MPYIHFLERVYRDISLVDKTNYEDKMRGLVHYYKMLDLNEKPKAYEAITNFTKKMTSIEKISKRNMIVRGILALGNIALAASTKDEASEAAFRLAGSFFIGYFLSEAIHYPYRRRMSKLYSQLSKNLEAITEDS